MFKKNILVHNVTEILVYSGIAVLFAPLFEPVWVIVLLLFISAYDAFAVWKSKHMVTMAEFQIEADVFAGLSIPYKSRQSASVNKAKTKTQHSRQCSLYGSFRFLKGYSTQISNKILQHSKPKTQDRRQKTGATQAILGGGDITFPLIFAASVMESLIRGGLFGPLVFFKALTIPIITTIALLLLMIFGKRGRYYPAMPFLTAACLVGYGAVLLI